MALCGGEIETGTRVDEEWLLTVERKEFVALLRTPETQARIRHTLKPASLCGIDGVPPKRLWRFPSRALAADRRSRIRAAPILGRRCGLSLGP